jgi:hypothetical protein
MRQARPVRATARPPRQPYAELGGEFTRLELGRRIVYLRNDLTGQAAAIIAAMSRPPLQSVHGRRLDGAGNRRSGFRLNLADGPELFIRYERRGGLMRFLARDWYWGVTPRPLRELTVAAEAYRRGIAIAEPLGAAFQWLVPGLYRGAFLTRALHGMTLWQFVQTDDDPRVRMHVAAQARRVIDFAHQKGLFHADLNLHNLFVITAGESFSVALLDLDKARIYPASLAVSLRANNLARLRRSINKLNSGGDYFNQPMIATLTSR